MTAILPVRFLSSLLFHRHVHGTREFTGYVTFTDPLGFLQMRPLESVTTRFAPDEPALAYSVVNHRHAFGEPKPELPRPVKLAVVKPLTVDGPFSIMAYFWNNHSNNTFVKEAKPLGLLEAFTCMGESTFQLEDLLPL